MVKPGRLFEWGIPNALYSVFRPLWIDVDIGSDHRIACWRHRGRLVKPSLVLSGGRELRQRVGHKGCEVHA